ncbi:conserved hypothetical protein [Talaromyces stipitatus ATCC 10500]|uniref:Uncharacterized protein n=1 Tax=Talaromyces stipitatus (strain ATCC 10500 / CBS 375.48 / QM 6759 / NRRL 1006) TaxID=441959 RepID=B8MAA3_TALSN|nr:uncharacterized protein TSTA_123380 [Talaromyces stipitatus ATCC 10500]EED18605.1 conserved hypothetical protein [Talaromyces stipitatus ATCC 10500]
MKIAIGSGITENQLSLLSKPEAAALYSLRAIQSNTIKDLLLYHVQDLSPLRLKGVVEGSGDGCGSIILDEHFEQFLENLPGFQAFELLPEHTGNAALQYWQDSIEPRYTRTDQEDDQDDVGWELPLLGLPNQPLIGLEGGFLQLSDAASNMPCATPGEKGQDGGHPLKAILLVSGLGGCEYLNHRLCKANPKITILQPPDAWQALVSGAVLRGLEGNLVQSCLARCHYGINIQEDYDAARHGGLKKHWCEYKQC